MFTPLAKLAIGLSATMATAFYYLAAAPPASAQYEVCGPGNFSSECTTNSSRRPTTTQPPRVIRNPVPVVASPSPSPVIADPVPVEPVVASPSPVIADPVPVEPVVASPSPVIADPVPEPVLTAPAGDLGNIYPPRPYEKPTAIPEPGTVVALLVTGAGILCSARKRNKQVRQQR
jgi:hypothetical protein